VKAGDRLVLGFPKKELCTYLAVSGGFNCEKTLGSVSTVMRDQFGRLTKEGNKLSDGDLLPFDAKLLPCCRSVPQQFVPDFPEIMEIGVLPTYQFEQFKSQTRANFF
jgi:allophanate hydrolase subunit 2